jgi:hypothetical protein
MAWGGNHDFLKAGGVDDEAVANAYYDTIDPGGLRMTQGAWEEVNGFKDPLNEVVGVNGYFNEGDLSFWRSIRMVVDQRPGYEGNIAFTTGNYKNEAFSNIGPRKAESIVNMEYSPGPDGDRITKFYVYAVDPINNNGVRVPSATFDTTNEEFFLPAACYSCHGGDDDAEAPLPDGYNEGSGETNATFLLLDATTMTFNNTSLASLEANFKKMNAAILDTDPTKATRALIKGIYGGPGLPRDTQDLTYIPSSWAGEEGEEVLYREVVIPLCRNCHTTSDTKLLSLSWWKANPAKIREVVFHEQTMPNSRPGYKRFWMGNQAAILGDALDRFEMP